MDCLICNKTIQKKIPYPRESPQHKDIFQEIAICDSCDYGFALPHRTQEELSKIYSDGSYWDTVPTTSEFFRYQTSQCQYRIKRAIEHINIKEKKSLKVLDIGSGNCPLGEALKHHPWNIPIEYDYLEPDLSKKPSPHTPRNFEQKRIIELSEARQYDIIFLNHVLEHVADPRTFLEELKRKLKRDGILYVETPNLDHLHKPDVFPHCHFFSEEAVKVINDQAGLTTISSGRFGLKLDFSSIYNKIKLKLLSILSNTRFHSLYDKMANDVYGFDNTKGDLWVYWIAKPKTNLIQA